MAKIKSVERQMAQVEGFEVSILHPDGRDVRSDRTGMPGYTFRNGAKNDFTVAQWKEQRFFPLYPGFDVTVWCADGSAAVGQTKLGTVRDSYLEES